MKKNKNDKPQNLKLPFELDWYRAVFSAQSLHVVHSLQTLAT